MALNQTETMLDDPAQVKWYHARVLEGVGPSKGDGTQSPLLRNLEDFLKVNRRAMIRADPLRLWRGMLAWTNALICQASSFNVMLFYWG